MKTVNYRREIPKPERKIVIDKYKNLRDASGGIFTPTMRRRLLGVKKQSSDQYQEDTADFWYDVRNTVRNALKDLELICEVASPEQLEQIFTESPTKEEKDEVGKINDPDELQKFLARTPSLRKFLITLFKDYVMYKKMKVPNSDVTYTQAQSIEKSDAWRSALAFEITKICFQFFKDHNLVTSKAHQRLVEEVEDMLDVEMGHAYLLPRDRRNIKFA